MTETNLFQEIQDDLERQRLEALAKKYGGLALAIAVTIILATAAVTGWNSWQMQKNQQATGALLKAMSKEDTEKEDEQVKALEAYANQYGGTSPSALALLHAAKLAAKAGHPDKAIQLYDRLAQDKSADTVFRQFAELMSVRSQMDIGKPEELGSRLEPLTKPDMPWSATAKEYQAYLALRAGDKAKAIQLFAELAQSAAVSASLSARATDMLRYLEQ